ncbi:hypothetical protein M8J76_016205 [Diaphorina citri]|nr:hypothetical protein M8J76_016205 [Diaphorina citri]
MLCEFSKVLERIIKTKIHELASSPISPANQFGFVSGSSTINSMLELSRIIDCASDKYVMVIFIDIMGAFDNVRWHRVIERMVEINLPAARNGCHSGHGSAVPMNDPQNGPLIFLQSPAFRRGGRGLRTHPSFLPPSTLEGKSKKKTPFHSHDSQRLSGSAWTACASA